MTDPYIYFLDDPSQVNETVRGNTSSSSLRKNQPAVSGSKNATDWFVYNDQNNNSKSGDRIWSGDGVSSNGIQIPSHGWDGLHQLQQTHSPGHQYSSNIYYPSSQQQNLPAQQAHYQQPTMFIPASPSHPETSSLSFKQQHSTALNSLRLDDDPSLSGMIAPMANSGMPQGAGGPPSNSGSSGLLAGYFSPTSFFTSSHSSPPDQSHNNYFGGGDFLNQQQQQQDFEDERPLLEELGINFTHIRLKTLAVLNPIGSASHDVAADQDLAGPLVFCLLFGFSLLLHGKIHFGYIYGIALLGSCGMYALLNLMADQDQSISFTCTVSVLGYCLLPMSLLSLFAAVLSLQGLWGYALSLTAVAWSACASSKLFTLALSSLGGSVDVHSASSNNISGPTQISAVRQPGTMGTGGGLRALVAYPCTLLYGVFALLAIF